MPSGKCSIEDLGVLAFCVTDDLDEARALCDRVVRLPRGAVAESGGLEMVG